MPGTLPRADALSASTGRPARVVTKSSCRCSLQLGVAREALEPLGQPRTSLAKLAAEAAKRRRGTVAQVRAVLLDGAVDRLRERAQARVDRIRDGGERGVPRRRPRARDAPRLPARPSTRSREALRRRACSLARRARPPAARRGHGRAPALPRGRGARRPRSSAAAARRPPPGRRTARERAPPPVPARSPRPPRGAPGSPEARAARGPARPSRQSRTPPRRRSARRRQVLDFHRLDGEDRIRTRPSRQGENTCARCSGSV